jgi:hypothetical protein
VAECQAEALLFQELLLTEWTAASILLLTSWVNDRLYVGQLLANLCGYLLAGARCARPHVLSDADRRWVSMDIDIDELETSTSSAANF